MAVKRKLFFTTLLVLLVCAIVGCAAAGLKATTNTSTRASTLDMNSHLDYERFQVTQEEIASQHAQFGKKYCNATLDNEFAENRVLIIVYPFAMNVEYTEADFWDIGCTKLQDISDHRWNPDEPSRTICLTIQGNSKQAVLDAIRLLEKRDDIYVAQPDYTYSIGESPVEPT